MNPREGGDEYISGSNNLTFDGDDQEPPPEEEQDEQE
jgi:hypothetical protein